MELSVAWRLAWIVPLAVGLSYALTWLARGLAPKIGLVDVPDGQRKLHARPTPLLGGVAVYGAFLGTILVSQLMDGHVWDSNSAPQTCMFSVLVSAGLLVLLGLWDDRFGLRARSKFLLQIAACLPFVFWGRCVESIHFLGLDIHLGPYGCAFTILWLVACTNMVNLMDGLDGLASAVGLISLISIGILASCADYSSVAFIAFILAGNLVGFLLHNWPPARIFLGDAGSLTIGFFVGALSLEACLKEAAGITLVAPTVLLSVPLFDTVMAMVRRKLNGRKIAEPDREHMHHCFRARGMTTLQALLAIASISLAMAVAAVFATILRIEVIAVITCLMVLGLLISARLFGYYETQLIVQRMLSVYHLVRNLPRPLDSQDWVTRLLEAHRDTPGALWGAVCERFAAMHGKSLQLICQDSRDSNVFAGRMWRNGEAAPSGSGSWQFRCTVQRGRGAQVTVIASGGAPIGLKTQPIGDLVRLFDGICRCWPLAENDVIPEGLQRSTAFPLEHHAVLHANAARQDLKLRAA